MITSDRLAIAAFTAFICAVVLSKVVQHLGVKRHILDTPNIRSSHSVPVPRIGGIAIALATVGAWTISIGSINWTHFSLLAGSILLAAVGVIDDLRPLNPVRKYASQVFAALLVVCFAQRDFRIDLLAFELGIHGWLASVLLVVWITAVINAYNFIDGIDGLSAGVGIIVSIAVAYMIGGSVASLLVPLASALAGFLVWNAHPANIFMGDGGSQFIGFVLATAILFGPETELDIFPAIIVFTPVLFDTGLTIVRRIMANENILAPHRSHLYQKLTTTGFSHREVSNLYYGATALSAIVAIGYASGNSLVRGLLILWGMIALTAYAMFVARIERHYRSTLNDANPKGDVVGQ